MATELTSYFEAKVDDYTALVENTTDELGSATAELAEVNALVRTLVGEIAALDRAIAQLRDAASDEDLTPADIEDLAATLRTELINRRKKNAELMSLQERVKNVQILQDGSRTLLAAYRAGLAQCTQDAKNARVRGTQQAVWFSSETETAVAEYVAASQTLLAEISATPDPPADPESEEAANRALITAANARVVTDIPKVLRDRARTRATTLVDDYLALIASQRTSTEDQDAAHRAEHDGDDGALTQQWLAYERAETALRTVALGTAGKVERALGLLRAVRDGPPLTAAESARITSVALAADADALVTEAALDTVQAAVRAKQIELELAIVAAVLADPVADPGDDSSVQTLRNELAALSTTDLPAAKAAHTPALALELDTWEVAVPDKIWAGLVSYDIATGLLTAVASADIGALRSAFTAAETQLVAALGAAEANNQAQAFTAAAVAAGRARADFFVEAHGARLSSVVRGDA